MANCTIHVTLDTKLLIKAMQRAQARIQAFADQLTKLQVTELQQKIVTELFLKHGIHFVGSGFGCIMVVWRSQTFTVAIVGQYLSFEDESVPLDAHNFDELFAEAVGRVKKRLALTRGLK